MEDERRLVGHDRRHDDVAVGDVELGHVRGDDLETPAPRPLGGPALQLGDDLDAELAPSTGDEDAHRGALALLRRGRRLPRRGARPPRTLRRPGIGRSAVATTPRSPGTSRLSPRVPRRSRPWRTSRVRHGSSRSRAGTAGRDRDGRGRSSSAKRARRGRQGHRRRLARSRLRSPTRRCRSRRTYRAGGPRRPLGSGRRRGATPVGSSSTRRGAAARRRAPGWRTAGSPSRGTDTARSCCSSWRSSREDRTSRRSSAPHGPTRPWRRCRGSSADRAKAP